MKKVVYSLIILISSFFIIQNKVLAETFYEGDYISGEYINKVIDGKTYYLTMQYIKDSKGNIVYCLEPFVKFIDGKAYTQYTGDLTGYKDLSAEQKRKISLIIYYGYGYGDRTSSKWYVVTQYLVWKEVNSNANIYFTNTLNGTKISKYTNEQKAILNDVNNHDIVPNFVKKYILNYKEDYIIQGLNKDYEILNSDFSYGYNSSNNFVISEALNSGVIEVRKISNYYDNKVAIFDSTNSQDVIRPGNVINDTMKINVVVNKGDITLDIRNDNSVYTIESDFSNTCYEINKGDVLIDSVCTNNEELIYKTDSLEYGEYTIKQVSVGIGYIEDKETYTVIINDNNRNASLILYNKLLKNDIQLVKYACKDDECSYEENALFEVYDRDNNLVDSLITNDNGYSYITLGYGSYKVKQIKGIDGYTLSESFTEKIVDESTLHYKELYNYYIVHEEVKGESKEMPVIPETSVDNVWILFLKSMVSFFKGIFAFLE